MPLLLGRLLAGLRGPVGAALQFRPLLLESLLLVLKTLSTVVEFIADPDLNRQEQLNITGASGIAADAEGTIYAADVGPQRLRKYVKKQQ